jgi:hypothetical protein
MVPAILAIIMAAFGVQPAAMRHKRLRRDQRQASDQYNPHVCSVSRAKIAPKVCEVAICERALE